MTVALPHPALAAPSAVRRGRPTVYGPLATRRVRSDRRGERRSGGYTLTETLIAAGIITVLVALLLPVFSRARQASRSVACLSNLRGLANAFHQYARDNGERLPYPAVTTIPWERSLLAYGSPPLFVCPADEELAPATNSSYDWRDTGIANTTLAGRSFASSNRHDAVLVFDALPSWHSPAHMNVALIDGSAQSIDQDECIADLVRPLRP